MTDAPRTPTTDGHEPLLVVDSRSHNALKDWARSPLEPVAELLCAGVATRGLLEQAVLERTGPETLPTLYLMLLHLQRMGVLRHTLIHQGAALLEVADTSPSTLFEPAWPESDLRYRLSDVVSLRTWTNRLAVAGDLADCQVILQEPQLAALLARLAEPHRIGDLPPLGACLPFGATVAYLIAAGVVVPATETPRTPVWEPHDLVFHRSSRRGLASHPVGATYRLQDSTEASPAIPAPRAGARRELPRPDLAQLEPADPPLLRVMEHRRSLRVHGPTPVSVAQLGEFLYRVARVRGHTPADPAKGRPYPQTNRPYPNGGAAYELECYVTVLGHGELGTASYHYEADAHALVRLTTSRSRVKELLADAAASTGGAADPRLLLNLTSRHKRLAWKYSGMAYATTLKNVGTLYQSMYLVATAMGLAPCALGNGNTPLIVAALGLDESQEVPVGEFILGTRPDDGGHVG